MNSYYSQPPQREENNNNNNNNLGIAIGALGAGALAAFGGRALYKNIDARRARSKAQGGPRGGQSGAITRDNPTAAEVYASAGKKYPDPGGGGLSALEKQAGASEQPVVKTAAYEEGSAVDKLMKSLLPEVNKEAGQMTATESSRQTRALKKQDILEEKEYRATQAMARGILSDLKEKQPVGEQLKSKGLAMAGMPGEGPLQIDDGMRLINIDSPAGVEILSNAGVTPEQATSYWSDKLKREGITAEQPTTLVQVDASPRRAPKVFYLDSVPATRSQQVAAESAEQRAKNFASASVDTMVELQKNREPIIKVQSVDALDTAGDQLDNKFESIVQRDTDSIFKGKQKVASELKFTAEDLLNSQLPMEETTDRIMAAASAGNETANRLLDPNVPTRQLAQMGVLGSSMKMDKASGRVEANPTYEIKGGAGASMSDRPSKARKLVGASVDDEGASNYGDLYGSSDGEYIDLDTGAGIEGSAYLKETEGYTERTNKGQTFLAGKVQEMTGSVPDSSRQERVLDEFVPIRQVQGEESSGVAIKPSTPKEEQFALMSKRRVGAEPRVQAGTKGEDINVTGNSLVGNVDVPENTPYFVLDDQVNFTVGKGGYNNIILNKAPLRFMEEAQTIPVGGRYKSGSDRVDIQPFMFEQLVETEGGQRNVKAPLYGQLMREAEDGTYKPTAISRSSVKPVLDAAESEFRDPAVQRAYIGATDPDYLKGLDPGAPIDPKPYHKSGYQAQRLDEELRNPKGAAMTGYSMGLPILSDPSAKHRFVTDLQVTTRQGSQYGKPVDNRGFNVKGAKGEPTGQSVTKGLGGAPAYEFEDARTAANSGVSVAFNAPRVEGGRSLTPTESRPVSAPSNPVATGMADTRAKLEQVKPSRVVYAPEPSPDSIDSYDVGSVMQQTMAQAGRRRGSRRN